MRLNFYIGACTEKSLKVLFPKTMWPNNCNFCSADSSLSKVDFWKNTIFFFEYIVLHFNTLLFLVQSIIQTCAKFGWDWQSGTGEKNENVKSLGRWRRQTRDKIWSEMLSLAFGSGKLKMIKLLFIQLYST